MYIYRSKSFQKAPKMLNICYCIPRIRFAMVVLIPDNHIYCFLYSIQRGPLHVGLNWNGSITCEKFKTSSFNSSVFNTYCPTFIVLPTVNVTILKGLVYTSFLSLAVLFLFKILSAVKLLTESTTRQLAQS